MNHDQVNQTTEISHHFDSVISSENGLDSRDGPWVFCKLFRIGTEALPKTILTAGPLLGVHKISSHCFCICVTIDIRTKGVLSVCDI